MIACPQYLMNVTTESLSLPASNFVQNGYLFFVKIIAKMFLFVTTKITPFHDLAINVA